MINHTNQTLGMQCTESEQETERSAVSPQPRNETERRRTRQKKKEQVVSRKKKKWRKTIARKKTVDTRKRSI